MPRSHRIAAWLWIASLQYYIVQLLAAAAWKGNSGFSVLHNTISDLGNTMCAPYNGRYVCSPLHDLMNASFVILGVTMILGSYLLLRSATLKSKQIALGMLIISGVGTIVVGLTPENTPGVLHAAGAALPFILGNLALILFGYQLSSTAARIITCALGVIGLGALPLFVTGIVGALGSGGVERIVAYPQSIWMIGYGIGLLITYRSRSSQ